MYSNEPYLLELLQEAQLVTPAALEDVRHKKKSQESTLEALLSLNLLTDETIAQTLAENAGMDYVDLKRLEVNPAVASRLAADAAVRFRVVPIAEGGGTLVVAVTDPLDFDALDSLRHVLTVEPEFVVASDSAIKQRQLDFYASQLDADQISKLDAQAIAVSEGAGGEGGDAPIIKMVYQILQEAYQNRASDIHIEPTENDMRVRYRIDGALHKVQSHPLRLLPSVVSRIKIMTGTMAISEKRLPQDGRIQAKFGAGDLDLRVSTIPTSCGESVVMRILDKSSLTIGLPQLGFFSDDQANFEEIIRLPDGILLVTGPTGSGKTTTLYACLNAINKPDRKIITVEDPVEYLLSGINQVQVKEAIGMTFAAALRSILRQAPNIIMIGEIRDLETASIAINASLTGHLVFSTLHTNDAPSAVARLADIGVKKFLIASAVRAIMAQRLVRGICKDCGQPAEIGLKEVRSLKLTEEQLAKAEIKQGGGCRTCRMTGYKGRMGCFEIFNITEEVRLLINGDESTSGLRRRARELGMRTLREDGIRKVLAGKTTASEVIRVTMADD
ncbi:MAG: type II secretion system protein E [Verrucomicrobiia bacterium Tous-C2TDCM]|nr:MAG: type II secretion system protein E [Verrucomicrobiae bacterium Tous-C2TDCM]